MANIQAVVDNFAPVVNDAANSQALKIQGDLLTTKMVELENLEKKFESGLLTYSYYRIQKLVITKSIEALHSYPLTAFAS
jgi:hypothetical protein